MKFNEIIECPHCHYQYLPAEIYFPDDLLGRPTNIVRDDDGKIEFSTGTQMNLRESFVCENCNKSFLVKGTITFKTEKLDDDNFDEDFSIKINKDSDDSDLLTVKLFDEEMSSDTNNREVSN